MYDSLRRSSFRGHVSEIKQNENKARNDNVLRGQGVKSREIRIVSPDFFKLMKTWQKSFLVVLAIFIAYFVWPTPWRVYHKFDEPFEQRVNRFSGSICYIYINGTQKGYCWRNPHERLYSVEYPNNISNHVFTSEGIFNHKYFLVLENQSGLNLAEVKIKINCAKMPENIIVLKNGINLYGTIGESLYRCINSQKIEFHLKHGALRDTESVVMDVDKSTKESWLWIKNRAIKRRIKLKDGRTIIVPLNNINDDTNLYIRNNLYRKHWDWQIISAKEIRMEGGY